MLLLRDRLLARMSEMGTPPDYVRLATEVLGIRNAPPAVVATASIPTRARLSSKPPPPPCSARSRST